MRTNKNENIKAYIAGPDVFRKDPKAHFDKVRELCAKHNITPLIPLDNELGDVTGLSQSQIANKIYQGNVQMIKDCDVVLANVTRFRGPSLDAGTAFEIGMAVALGKTVMCYSSDSDEDFGYDYNFHEVSRQCIDSNEFPEVENFGQFDNLMVSRSCSPKNVVFNDLETTITYINVVLVESVFDSVSSRAIKDRELQSPDIETYEQIKRRLDSQPVIVFLLSFIGGFFYSAPLETQFLLTFPVLGEYKYSIGFAIMCVAFYLAISVRGNLGMSSFSSKHFKE